MFRNGDLVTIKDRFRSPGETDRLYRIVNVNEATKRCYIELAHCALPLSPQELVSFEMIQLFWTAPTKVHYNDCFVLEDDQGVEYAETPDSDYLMSQATGEVFRICKRDEIDNPIEIEPLHQYKAGIERIKKEAKCDEALANRYYNLSLLINSEDLTVEQRKQIFAQLETLRNN